MRVVQISREDWKQYSEVVHKIVFNKTKEAGMDRIDYALVCENEEFKPLGYVTVKEIDEESVYWQFGGVFPDTKGTIYSFQVYQAFLRYTKDKYKRIYTLVENTNAVYLKFCAKVGFVIVGIKNYHGTVLLEHMLEFKEDPK